MAMPSQWDITLADGSSLYARYRHGYFYVAREPLGDELLASDHGGPYDGDMSNAEMMKRTATLLDWSVAIWDTPVDTNEGTDTRAVEAFFARMKAADENGQ